MCGGARHCWCSVSFIVSNSRRGDSLEPTSAGAPTPLSEVTRFPVNRLKVVLSLITSDNDYQLEQAKAAEAVAHQQNVDLEIVYADGNSVTQSSQLLDLIHKYKSELSAILVEPAGGTEFPQVGRAAVSAGIAWVVLNRDASSLADLRRSFQ